MSVLLEIRNLTKRFGGLQALTKVDFLLEEKRIAGLIGPNGAGKTTLFNMITGVYSPDEGSILFLGKEIVGKKRHEITARGIARTFQNIRLFPNMTTAENVLVGRHCQMHAGVWGAVSRNRKTLQEEAMAEKKVMELLSFVGLDGREDQLAKNLPYGDQRRLEIARALAVEAKLLLLDEPTAGMNPQETLSLTRFVSRIRDELGLSILLIEHDMRVVMGISDRVIVLDHGVKISEGPPEVIQRDSRVIEAYLGRPSERVRKRRPLSSLTTSGEAHDRAS
jgi:ABC-type branched-subunit amino acid transport system ATPase component